MSMIIFWSHFVVLLKLDIDVQQTRLRVREILLSVPSSGKFITVKMMLEAKAKLRNCYIGLKKFSLVFNEMKQF